MALRILSRALVGVLLAASPVLADEPPPEALVAELPFQPSHEPNRVLVDLAPAEQRPFVMMLDTGASASVVSPRMARALGVTVRRTKSDPYRRPTRLGREVLFWVDTRHGDTASRTGYEFGLLGGDFLGEYVVEIDYPGKRVRFFDPKRYRVPEAPGAPDEGSLAFRRVGQRILLPIEMNGKVADVLLDTGAPDNLVLSGKAASKLGIDVDSLPEFGKAQTVLGPFSTRFYEATTLRLAGFGFDPLPVMVAPRGLYNLAPNDSLLGHDLLHAFVVRIDYPRRRLWLKRTGERRATYMGVDYAASKRAGVSLVPYGDAIWAFRVLPEGAAARFGLREGDAIVSAEEGHPPPLASEVLERITARKALSVAREKDGGWVYLALPAGAPDEGAASAPDEAP